MRTESGQQGPRKDLSNSKASALMPQHSVLTLALGAMLLALCVSVYAQRPPKIPRIGYLTGQLLYSDSYRVEALRQGLRELGYVEGKIS
jgi:hypothetical protein